MKQASNKRTSSKRTVSRIERQRGFTLFELLVVLTILALLAALVAPRIVGYLGKAKSDVALSQMSNLATSLELYALDMFDYPSTEEGLNALVEAPDNAQNWSGPYLRDQSALTDPWGRPYLYEIDESGGVFLISSMGRDGEEGGEGEDADIFKS